MNEIEATFRVVTPMFISGADQSKAELRLPSIKGALRFWWRALAWEERVNGDLQEIREEEARLFGSADKGQAAVMMKLSEQKTSKPIEKGEILKDGGKVVGEGARYLGYGVMEAFSSDKKGTEAGQLTRPCLPAPFEFTVGLRLKPGSTEQQKKGLIEAIKLMGLTGGLGSKSRKGYGSLTLTELKHDNQKWTTVKGATELSELLKSFESDSAFPQYSALSSYTRYLVVEGNNGDSPLSLLNKVGREMVFYRSWGHNGKVLGSPREGNFKEDHDLMKGLNTSIRHPKRVAFGLPHNYGQGRDQQVTPKDKDRRASPLFIHIHQASQSDRPLAVLGFLPSTFLPENESLKLLDTTVKPTYDDAFWKPIEDFLERMKGTDNSPPYKRREKFGQVLEVGA